MCKDKQSAKYLEYLRIFLYKIIILRAATIETMAISVPLLLPWLSFRRCTTEMFVESNKLFRILE